MAGTMPANSSRSRNDPAQYDDLVDEWWDVRGTFAMLHWIAEARAVLIPPAPRTDAVAVDVACGGGLVAPYVKGLGYRHVGVDLSASALRIAREHGVSGVQADARALPVRDAAADVVVAGECLEHVPDLPRTVAELCRILRPGGTLVIDTIAATALARFVTVTVAERLPGGPPPGLHDPAWFVDRVRLLRECARNGVPLRLMGLRPALGATFAWLIRRREKSRMVPSRFTTILFQGVGTKQQEGIHDHSPAHQGHRS